MGDFLQQTAGPWTMYQLSIAVLLVALGFVARTVMVYVARHQLAKLTAKTASRADDVALEAVVGPLGAVLPVAGAFLAVRYLVSLQPEWTWLAQVDRVFRIVSILLLTWTAVRLVDAGAVLLSEMSERTESKLDDQLVPLARKGGKIFIGTLGFVGIAIFLSIPTSNMLAGLGIGGLALAFASRETLSNVFGAGILVTDRPFRRGDWIKTSDIEGAVESVGVRSTRVRTAQDSVVFIPNGKLVDSTINNLGTRRYRLLKQQFLVTAGGTPERLQAFITAIRDRILGDTVFAGEQTSVGLAGIGAGGISVDVTTYLDVTTDAAETQALNTLLLDIMALASQAGLTLGSGMRREVTG